MSKPFHFKQFSVHQKQCAMKIGTDGVLLGAWTSLANQPSSVLDVGSGTGIIALMLAQRSFAETIDAVEIDAQAYEECVFNFENSPWNDRLFCYHAPFATFAEEMDEHYDLIISNPPFFKTPKLGAKTATARETARFDTALKFEPLLQGVCELLSGQGVFSVILPYDSFQEFVDLAAQNDLHLQQLTTVKGNPDAKIKRCLLQFGLEHLPLQTDELTIETKRHIYTEKYKTLTGDFYRDK